MELMREQNINEKRSTAPTGTKQLIKTNKVHNANVCYWLFFCCKKRRRVITLVYSIHWTTFFPFFSLTHFYTIIKPIVLIVVKCYCSFHFISFYFFLLLLLLLCVLPDSSVYCWALMHVVVLILCRMLYSFTCYYMRSFSLVSSPKRITINASCEAPWACAHRLYSIATKNFNRIQKKEHSKLCVFMWI